MKTTLKNYLILFVFCFLNIYNSFAQSKTEGLKMFVEKKEKAFTDEGDYMRLAFQLSGLDYEQSTKPFIEKALLVPEIKKLNISNITDQNGKRAGFVLLQKDKHLTALTTTLNILQVSEINVDTEKIDIPGYIEMCK